MCGFVGDFSPSAALPQIVIESMLEAIAHRGPDARGVYRSEKVALGFCRLGIIDPVARSTQPMSDPQTGAVLVFNGEIYNYRELREELAREGISFGTDSDTEVLLQALIAWGTEAIPRLRGMFAFAFIRDGRAILARDPFGIKPLYYTKTTNGHFAFGSELKAIRRHPDFIPSLREDGLFSFLECQHPTGEETMLRGVYRLGEGTWMEVPVEDPKGARQVRYFAPQFLPSIDSMQEAVQAIRASVEESVRLHTRADVPWGTFLSGGIDSSYITALARPQHTFSVGFREAEGKFDESVHAAELSKLLGAQNHRRLIEPEEALKALPDILYALDEPQANLSSIPLYFLSALARESVTVVLSGEGADELFGGYEGYRDPAPLARYKKIPYPLRKAMSWLSPLLPLPVARKLRKGAEPECRSFVGEAHIAEPEQVEEILAARYHHGVRARDEAEKSFCGPDVVSSRQLVDLHGFMQKDILLKGDRMSMAHSLELRVPFLDTGVWGVASRLSSQQKVTAQETKVALRAAARDVLPEEWYNRPKKGFPVPMVHWLRREDFYREFRDVLLSPEAAKYFDTKRLQRMLDDHYEGRERHQRRLYSAYVWTRWSAAFLGGTDLERRSK